MISNQGTYCGELVRRDLLLALGDGVEEQVLQAGQDACLPSPASRGRWGGELVENTGKQSEA